MNPITPEQLGQDISGFLALKRALGHPYARGEWTLRSFERFVHQQARSRSPVEMEAMVSGWLSRTTGRKPVTVAVDIGVIRQLCLYRRRSDPHAFVPGREWAPQPTTSSFLPYVFSREEVRQIIDAADLYRPRNLGATTLRALLLILYCTGLRLGEAVRLQVRDVDLEQGLLIVRESKGKTRLVPFGADLGQVLSAYLAERPGMARAAGEDALLLRMSGDRLPAAVASGAIRRLLRKLGLKPTKGRVGPRPYDMRHTFAVHRLTAWYHQGLDIHARLPWLSAYMGHDDILGTEVYLTATPELMAMASQRFEARFRHPGRRP